jgi:hypothetical protein
VAVEIAGRSAGTLTVRADDVTRVSLPLPDDLDRSQPLEVRLVAERWVTQRRAARRLDLVSFRPLSLECGEP